MCRDDKWDTIYKLQTYSNYTPQSPLGPFDLGTRRVVLEFELYYLHLKECEKSTDPSPEPVKSKVKHQKNESIFADVLKGECSTIEDMVMLLLGWGKKVGPHSHADKMK